MDYMRLVVGNYMFSSLFLINHHVQMNQFSSLLISFSSYLDHKFDMFPVLESHLLHNLQMQDIISSKVFFPVHQNPRIFQLDKYQVLEYLGETLLSKVFVYLFRNYNLPIVFTLLYNLIYTQTDQVQIQLSFHQKSLIFYLFRKQYSRLS